MASVRVDALGLRLAAPAAMRGAAGGLRHRAETEFVPAVLSAMQRRLERTYGRDAVILIRRLIFRCALKPSAQEGAALAELLGEDLAAQVELAAVRERGAGALPQPSAAVQVYRDAAHREAAALIAAAERRAGPAGDKEDFGRAWRALARRPPAAVAAVLARCLLARKLEPVLRRVAPAELEALDAALAASVPAAVARVVRRALQRQAPPAARPAARSRRAPPRAGPERARTQEAAPAATSIEPRPWPPPDPAAEAVAPRPAARATGAAAAPAARTAPPPRVETPAQRSVEPPAANEVDARAAEPDAHGASIARDEAPARADEPPDEPDAASEFAVFESRRCGLLYLLNIAQRLEVAERLWQVGADEGAALAAVFARLAGCDDDPASGVLCARFPEPAGPMPTFQDWAREELIDGTMAAAAKLVAPTAAAEALQARIAAFEGWFAKPAAHDVAGWLAACHLAVFEAMTGETVAPGALAERLGVHGRIEIEADEIRVVMPMEAIDIDVRRAGLDADPGWLAWLNRRMVFEFEDIAP